MATDESRARVSAKFSEWELHVLRQALRIGCEDESLSAFASEKALDGLARKLDRLMARARPPESA